MAKIDRIKEFINYLKVLLVLVIATIISIIGWIVNNYNKNEPFIVYSAVTVVFILLVLSMILNRKIVKDIKSLEDLE